jgi:hypothetical protein
MADGSSPRLLRQSDRDIWSPLQTGLEMLPARLMPERAMSDREFQAFCLHNDLVQIARGRDGTIHIYPRNTIATSEANAEITAQLCGWNSRSNAGKVLGSSAGFFSATAS